MDNTAYHTKVAGENHCIIGQIELSAIESAISEMGKIEEWPVDDRDSHHILNQGLSLILRDHKHIDTSFRGKFKNLEIIIDKILKLGYGKVPGKIVAAYLPPGKVIKPHKDSGDYYTYHNRIHVPLVTNSQVIMTVDDDDFHMELGNIYLFPNLKRHAARNLSDVGRIHLIIDVLDARYSAQFYKIMCLPLTFNFLWLGSIYRMFRYLKVQRTQK